MHFVRFSAAAAAGVMVCLAAFSGIAGAANFERGPRNSDRNLIFVRTNLERIIDNLQNDRHDYAGHRVAAIGDLQQARADIVAALGYDRSHETIPLALSAPASNGSLNWDPRGGRGSDRNLRRMIRVIERDVDRLQHDQEDYGGLRVKAIGELQQARTQLADAIVADRGH